ncbi:MAG: hypothetical protein K8T10_08580 [Candidatus Eremiobacteraeota bacterium]|nr:hypothetical protein [Candidatus Eremiobacteraeota bacterium]
MAFDAIRRMDTTRIPIDTAITLPKAEKTQSMPIDKAVIGRSEAKPDGGVKKFFIKTGNKVRDILKSDTTKGILKWAGLGIAVGAIGGALGGAVFAAIVGSPIACLLDIGGLFTGTTGMGTAFASQFVGAMAIHGGSIAAIVGGVAGTAVGVISEPVEGK